jgi:hypothetical protein
MIQAILGKKTVASITSGLTSMVTDLRALAEASTDEIVKNNVKIDDLEKSNTALRSEISSATSIASKIEALVS